MCSRMSDSTIRQRIQKMLGETTGQVSSAFMEISSGLRSIAGSAEIQKKLDRLFQKLMDSNRALSAEFNELLDQREKEVPRFERLQEEKRRLEVLYTSGILFSSETELQSLMEKAIDVVVRELGADEGFIVLATDEGQIESIYSRNMVPEEHPDARELSTTVIRNTLAQSKPLQVDRIDADENFARRNSVLRLGITAVLCVPLLSGTKALGAVYLDRRNKENPFTESDLVFLLSFGKQIVRGLETSIEISSLQNKLVSGTSMKFSDLRAEFDCTGMIGASRKLFEVVRIASKIAPTDAPVIILGENGTGKDLLAHAIRSFPVPFSPRIITGASVGAIFEAIRTTSNNFLLAPIMPVQSNSARRSENFIEVPETSLFCREEISIDVSSPRTICFPKERRNTRSDSVNGFSLFRRSR